MTQATIIFGSNSGDKRDLIESAVSRIAFRTGRVVSVSSFYETEPWGFDCPDLFLNRIAVFETELTAHDFLSICLETEQEFGRVRSSSTRYTSRTIDIDILFYGTEAIRTPELIVPHPRMQLRKFVLVPLQEVMPDFVHPILQRTVSELLYSCPDRMKVKRLP